LSKGDFSREIWMNKNSPLNNKASFDDYSIGALKVRIIRATRKLYKAGKINAPYSVHDFRHYYAINNYKQDKDIYKLSKMLDHSNIAITQTYLKSLKLSA